MESLVVKGLISLSSLLYYMESLVVKGLISLSSLLYYMESLVIEGFMLPAQFQTWQNAVTA